VKSNIIAERVEILQPELNRDTFAEIGETLIEKEVGYKYDAIKLLTLARARNYYVKTEIKNGELLINDSETQGHLLFSSEDKSYGIAIPKQGGNTEMFVSTDGFHIRIIPLEGPVEFEKMKVPIVGKEYFKQEFIYNGKVGNGLKFIYREFIDNTARPAFTQDLQYDLAEGNIIGFKGLRIRVINASNTKIEYEVQSNFTR
jgi:hypothetical protein